MYSGTTIPRVSSTMVLLLMVVLFGAISAGPAVAQTDTPGWTASTLDALRRLHSAALEDRYGYEQLAHLTDSIGPRPVGSLQAAAAVEYVASELRSLGFDVHLEKVKVPRWSRGEERAELVAYRGQVPGTTQKIVVAALGAAGVATSSEGITAEVVPVNDFAELSAMPREKIAGKMILFNKRFDARMANAGFAFDAYNEAVEYRNDGRAFAAKLGAAAVLVRSVGGSEFRLVHVGATDYMQTANIPAAAIAAEDADLISRLSAQGKVRFHLLLGSNLQGEVDSYNVIADLRGTDHPDQIVIVSGHLDSWDLGTGALDDAAGVSVALATAHLVHQLDLKPSRTLRIIVWMGEEPGLLGARAYAREHAGEMASHFAAIESDSGAGHAIGVYVSGDEAIPNILQPVSDILKQAGAGILRRSEEAAPDLIPLHFRGVPAFAPIHDTRNYFDYHHTAADTLDKINPDELRENIAVVSVLAYALATTKQGLPRQQLTLPDWLK